MELALIVMSVVTVTTVLLGITGYVIDKCGRGDRGGDR